MRTLEIDRFIELGKQLDQVRNNSYDLWSWLPSKEATKKAHGDYCDEHCPPIHDICIEASIVLSVISGFRITELNDLEWLSCYCGECERVSPEEFQAWLKKRGIDKTLAEIFSCPLG